MVILLVLGLLIVALTLTTTFGVDVTQLDQFQRVAQGRESNYQVARSAFELGLALLNSDDSDVDGPEDLWASGAQEMTWEGRLLRIEVEDEERRFPVNALVPETLPPGEVFEPSEQQDLLAKAFVRFLDSQGVQGQRAAPALIDWMDPDQVPTVGGSEVGRDPKVAVKNARLDSIQELEFVRDWVRPSGPPPLPLLGGLGSKPIGEEVEAGDLDVLSADSPQRLNQSQWSDWLSLYSEGKININTAPREILLALDEQMTEALVEEIVAKRQEGSLSGEEDLRQIQTLDEDLIFRLGRLIRYNSQYFRIRVGVATRPGPITLEAIVLRNGDDTKVVRWEVR